METLDPFMKDPDLVRVIHVTNKDEQNRWVYKYSFSTTFISFIFQQEKLKFLKEVQAYLRSKVRGFDNMQNASDYSMSFRICL